MPFTQKELAIILQEREEYRIEFKERLANLDKEMVAFANASGGRIFLGITDEGKIVGTAIDNKIKSQIQDIANNCDPPIKIKLEEYKNILVIDVREGIDKPHRCASGFYTRTGPNSQKLSRDQIVNFIQAEGKVRYDELIKRNFTARDIDPEKIKRFLELSRISSVLDRPLSIKIWVSASFRKAKCFSTIWPCSFSRKTSTKYIITRLSPALFTRVKKKQPSGSQGL